MFDASAFQLISLALTFLISISLHEYAHARASTQFGDPTPKMQGRLTPNPLVHIDLLGFLMIFLIHFGRGRPVIVNPAYYKHPLRDELLVALAGPATNLLLATLGIFISYLYMWMVNVPAISFSQDVVLQFWQLFSWINVSLALFNLLPFPPLDGYRIVTFFFPQIQPRVVAYGRQISLVVIALLILPTPIRSAVSSFITTGSEMIFGLIRAFRGIIFL